MKVRSHLNNKQGLYDPANEHDACGVGLIVTFTVVNRTVL